MAPSTSTRSAPIRAKGAKARIRTSPAGDVMCGTGGSRGFTLLELIVVLVIVGLVLALVPGLMLRTQPGLDVEVAARAVADGLRRTRSQAMLTNREEVFSVDVEQGLFRAGRDRFFPDGGSTGGAIDLALDGQHSRVSVDWLTGQVEIERALP